MSFSDIMRKKNIEKHLFFKVRILQAAGMPMRRPTGRAAEGDLRAGGLIPYSIRRKPLWRSYSLKRTFLNQHRLPILWLYVLLAAEALLRAAFTRAGASAVWPEVLLGAAVPSVLLLLGRSARRHEEKREQRAFVENIDCGLAAIAKGDVFGLLHANPAFYRMFGYDAAAFAERFEDDLLQAVYAHDRSAVLEQIQEKPHADQRVRLAFRIVNRAGRKRWLQMDAFFSHRHGGRDVYLCVFTDVTDYRLSMQQAEMEVERHRIISSISDDILFDYDLHTKSFTSTQPLTDFQKHARMIEQFHDTCVANGLIYGEDTAAFDKLCAQMDAGAEKVSAELRVRVSPDRYVWYRLEGALLADKQGSPFKIIGRLANIDKQKRETEVLTKKLQYDPMTGILNKVATEQQIDRLLREKSGAARKSALFIVDIDNFKLINDTRGHLFGDRVITHIAREIKRILSPDDLFGRIGGDEFVIFLRDIASADEARSKAEALRGLFEKMTLENETGVGLSGSTGIALAPEEGLTYRELFAKADQALYEAKAHGKDGFAFYSQVPGHDTQERQGLWGGRWYEYSRRRSRAPFDQEVLDNTLNLLNNQTYEQDNTQHVMAYLCRYYHAKRLYIVEFSAAKKLAAHIHGWCEKGYELDHTVLGGHPAEFWEAHFDCFNDLHVFQSGMAEAPYTALDENPRIRGSMQHLILQGSHQVTLAVLECCDASPTFSEFAVNTFMVLHKLLQHHIFLLENLHAYEHLASTDALTGVHTYESFHTAMKRTLQHNREKRHALISCDFNRFAEINDLLGHEKADQVLVTFASVVQKSLAEGELMGRVSADIFLILATFSDKETLDARLAEWDRTFQKKVAAFNLPNGAPLSSGIYVIGPADENLSNLFDKCNAARKLGKGQRKSVSHYYDSALHDQALYEQDLENSMLSSLKMHDFLVYLQPKYRLNDRGIAGAEALVRWNHPTRGLIQPSDFIPLFEKNHFILDLDFYVLEVICQLLQGWQEEHRPIVPIAVNFSRIHLLTKDFVPRLLSIVERYDVRPADLEIELTESAFVNRSQETLEVVEKLRRLGFAIAMDDFGSGYSSFNSLKYLPIDVLKLDKNFFREKEPTPKEIIIIENLVRLAKQLNLCVVSEGVEYEWQAEFLCSVDCDLVQGYLFSRPVPISTFEGMLTEEHHAS